MTLRRYIHCVVFSAINDTIETMFYGMALTLILLNATFALDPPVIGGLRIPKAGIDVNPITISVSHGQVVNNATVNTNLKGWWRCVVCWYKRSFWAGLCTVPNVAFPELGPAEAALCLVRDQHQTGRYLLITV